MLISEAEAIPAYTVFTDEELAAISSLVEKNEITIKGIKGIRQKRAEKYVM